MSSRNKEFERFVLGTFQVIYTEDYGDKICIFSPEISSEFASALASHNHHPAFGSGGSLNLAFRFNNATNQEMWILILLSTFSESLGMHSD